MERQELDSYLSQGYVKWKQSRPGFEPQVAVSISYDDNYNKNASIRYKIKYVTRLLYKRKVVSMV